MSRVRTFTGITWNLVDPRPDDVDIADVAHSLAHQCRWGGHCRQHYSTAEHSVRVSWHAEELARSALNFDGSTEPPPAFTDEQIRAIAFAGLMHDAEEAYPPYDMARPMKQLLGHYTEPRPEPPAAVLVIAAKARAAVCQRFGLLPYEPKLVERADLVLLATEWRDLMGGRPDDQDAPDQEPPLSRNIEPWGATRAELRFLLRFKQLAPHESLRCAIERMLPDDPTDIIPTFVPSYERQEVLLMRLVMADNAHPNHKQEES